MGHPSEGVWNIGIGVGHELSVGLQRQPFGHRRLIGCLEHRFVAGVGGLLAAEGYEVFAESLCGRLMPR